ncbi:MAG: ABC transporter ATP-binding protein [Planctomycetota bacterium]|nr:MAG: ABC transporter ATP-binding protein [Planctomycetota bacterium]
MTGAARSATFDSAGDPSGVLIRAEGLRKEYRMGDSVVHALDGVDLTIRAGEFVSVTGASGSGKSTLMHILGCLDRPTTGRLEFDGQQIDGMSDRQLAEVRNRKIGFVFQTFNLINRTSALDNVCVPLMYTRRPFSRKRAKEALERVGLAARASHTPSEMSGGECQRVAIARAIVNRPTLLLADEPTGNLDSRTTAQIMDIFHELHAAGMTIVLVTHEMDIAARAERMIAMRDGRILEDVFLDHERREAILAAARDTHTRLAQPTAPRKRRGSPPRLASGLP